MSRRIACCLGGIFTLSATVYALLFRRFPVGYFNDDALYILGAKSLLQGHFVNLQGPHHEPLTWILPGYPLFLAPFVWLAGTHWIFLKFTSESLTLACAVLLWILLRGCGNDLLQLSAVALFALNPSVALYSGAVMSEPCFTFFTLFVFIVLRSVLEEDSWISAGLGGGLLAWAALLRPEGLILLPSVALGLAWNRQWKSLGIMLTTAGFLYGTVLNHHYLTLNHSGDLTYFLGQYQFLTRSNAYQRLAQNSFAVLRTLAVSIILGITWLPGGTRAALAGKLLTGVVIFLGLNGLRRISLDRTLPEGLTLAIAIYGLLYLGIHMLWTQVELRYFIPVLPFFLLFCLEGGRQYQNWMPSWVIGLVTLTIMGGYLLEDCNSIHQVQETSHQLSWSTFQWIRTALPQNALVLTPNGSTVFLYTERHTTSIPPMEDDEEFRYWATKRGITEVLLYQQEPLILAERRTLWNRVFRWAEANPEIFHPVYHNEGEGTSLYSVEKDDLFQRAFELYIDASLDFDKSMPQEGLRKIKDALRLIPHFQRGLNAYASGLMAENRTRAAQVVLLQALAIDPHNALTLFNLARISRQEDESSLAANYEEACARSIQSTGDFMNLLPLITSPKSATAFEFTPTGGEP